jgi:hypothetical protein
MPAHIRSLVQCLHTLTRLYNACTHSPTESQVLGTSHLAGALLQDTHSVLNKILEDRHVAVRGWFWVSGLCVKRQTFLLRGSF